jgi:long-chain fatty acid transport protein
VTLPFAAVPLKHFATHALVTAVALGETAEAGGLSLPIHGARSLERGGAFIAGADDADALWLNPAGLGHLAGNKKQALLFDVVLLYQPSEYERLAADGTLLPRVTNQQPGTLVPALAGALGIGDKLVIAGGLASPYTGFHRYAGDGPQRYASVGLDGSTFVVVTAGVGYRVSDRLRLGATLQNFVSLTKLSTVANGCPSSMTCAPEDPAFDLGLTLDQTDSLAPSGSIGLQYDATEQLTLGLAVQGPTRIAATGKLTVALPSSVVFEDATVSGTRAELAFTLPAAIRTGIEYRPLRSLRVEAALAVELWSAHDRVTLKPDAIVVDNVAGGPFTLGDMTIPRDYKTTFAPALAIEWHGPKLMLGAGYSYETAAAPARTVSVLAVDSAKHLIGFGGGYEDAGWQIGAAFGFVAFENVDVPLANAAVPQLAPLGTTEITNVNAGSYRSRYLIGGLRFARRW